MIDQYSVPEPFSAGKLYTGWRNFYTSLMSAVAETVLELIAIAVAVVVAVDSEEI